METEKTIVGKCPLCGGDVIKTFKGYACANSLEKEASCSFFLFNTVGNRRLSDDEAVQLLSEKKILLDGFSSKEGKAFSALLQFNPDGTVEMKYQLGTCPKCHGTLFIGWRSISCGNFKGDNPCKFTIWRNQKGHDFSLQELEELINGGETSTPVATYDNQGNRTEHRFGLNEQKEVVVL